MFHRLLFFFFQWFYCAGLTYTGGETFNRIYLFWKYIYIYITQDIPNFFIIRRVMEEEILHVRTHFYPR